MLLSILKTVSNVPVDTRRLLQNKPLSTVDTLRSLFSSVRELLRASLRVRQRNKQ
jgi:hypothetical protein